MFLSNISIKRPIMTSMGLSVFLLFGILAYFTLTLNLMPDVEIPFVTVQTIYPGAGPKEIETQVTKKIEDAIGTISKIELIRSFSMEGVSYVIIQFEIDKNVDIANQEVKDKVNAILNDLPKDADLPVIQKFDVGAFPIMDIVYTGDMTAKELYEIADRKLKDRLSQIEGVANVNLSGGEKREIRVELDNRIVFQNSISLLQLSQILAIQNMDLPGGIFQQKDQEYSVRMKGEFSDIESIKELDIPTAFGYKKLGQIAAIKDGKSDVRERSTYFNKLKNIRNENVIILSIMKSPDGNTVQMAEAIKEALPVIEKELPSNSKLSIVRDSSIFIESSVEDTLGNIVLGIILTGLVLLFFLHDLRSTIIVATAMPFSIISTFLFLQMSGFSLNIMTLMGLSTSVGILVTNSVVVLENIFRHKEMGHNKTDASEKGTSEIAVAVIASTLTNIVVFLPIANMSSLIGQFFKEFALTVTYATIFSLIASFTVTPMLASLILPDKNMKKHPIGEKLESMFRGWELKYQLILKYIFQSKRRSFLVIGVSFVSLALTFIFVGPFIGFEFMPMLDEGDLKIEAELPQGYNINETSALIQSMENRIKQRYEIGHILTTIGSTSQLDVGTNLALIKIKLINADDRELSSNEVASVLIRDLSDIPNAKIRAAAVSSGGGPGDAPVRFYLLGQSNEILENYKTEIIESIKDVPGLINLNTSSRSGKPEITLTPNRKKIADAGLNVYDLAMTLRCAIEGVIATKYREEGNEYDIRVSLTDESVDTPEEIGNITVISKNGKYRLSQLADINFTEGYSKILHKDKYKSIEFSGYVAAGFALGDIKNQIDSRLSDLNLESGYALDWGGSVKMMQEMMIDMLTTFIIALLLTYMLLAAILESLTQPLMILGTVPLALIGVVFALAITQSTMNMVSMMAIIMLLGIVVNNAILILDYTNILRKRGKNVHDALLEACPTKLKPVLMATVAIILGMMPMALGIGSAGVEFRQPMGIISIGGLVVSSVLTLIVIPSIYFLTAKSE